MFFNDWQSVWRVAITGVCAYAALVVMLRISGKRTLSKMNAFDFVVTIALGSILASVIVSRSVSLSEGLTALLCLMVLQWIVAWVAVRLDWWRKLIKSEPRLLAFRGALDEEALRDERMTPEAVNCALRSAGLAALSEAEAVVLETDGTVSVVKSRAPLNGSSLNGVRGFSKVTKEGAQAKE